MTIKPDVLQTLRECNLSQEAPRVRSVLVCDGFVRLSFPYMTFGFHPRMVDWGYNTHIFAVLHHRPWKTIEDILKARGVFFQAVPWFMQGYNTGLACVGLTAARKVAKGKITASEAFWTTSVRWSRNTFHPTNQAIPRSMYDLTKPPQISQEFCIAIGGKAGGGWVGPIFWTHGPSRNNAMRDD